MFQKYLNTPGKLLPGLLLLMLHLPGFGQMISQQALMPGLYTINVAPASLSNVPPHVLEPHIHQAIFEARSIPFASFSQWNTRLAWVALDSSARGVYNQIIWLNDAPQQPAQTQPMGFRIEGHTLNRTYSFPEHPLDKPHRADFYFQGNRFSVYQYPKITSIYKAPQGSSMGKQGVHLEIELAVFDLLRTLPLQQIIYTTSDSIPLYSSRDTVSAPIAWFTSGENILVYAQNRDAVWTQVLKSGINEKGTAQQIKGWIRQEDRYRHLWQSAHASSADFSFEVVGADPDQTNQLYTPGLLAAIKIIRKSTGKVLQVITDIDGETRDRIVDALHVQDVNFDGYPDLWADFALGGAGPNNLKIFYVYDPAKDQFIYQEGLSALPQIQIDSVHQRILSSWRASAGEHGAARYRFREDTLQQIYTWEQYWGQEYFVWETTSRLLNDSTWVTHTRSMGPAYQDTVKLFRKPHPGRKFRLITQARETYFTILDEHALWYYVQAGTDGGPKGWIPKETLFPEYWEPLELEHPRVYFEKSVLEDGAFILILSRDKGNHRVRQIIGPLETNGQETGFETGDYNQDGAKDLCFSTPQGNSFFLYHKRKHLFIQVPEKSPEDNP